MTKPHRYASSFSAWCQNPRNYIPDGHGHPDIPVTKLCKQSTIRSFFLDGKPDFSAINAVTDDSVQRYNIAVRLGSFAVAANLFSTEETQIFAAKHGLYLAKPKMLRPIFRPEQPLTVRKAAALEARLNGDVLPPPPLPPESLPLEAPFTEAEWNKSVHGYYDPSTRHLMEEYAAPQIPAPTHLHKELQPTRTAGRAIMDIIANRRDVASLFDDPERLSRGR